jgi:hypothetical protein
MKSTLFSMVLVSLFAVVALSSCKEVGETSPFDGRLSGTFSGFPAGDSGYYFTVGYDSSTFPIAPDGSFDFMLPTPATAKLPPLEGPERDSFLITPADLKVYSAGGVFSICKHGQHVGGAEKSKKLYPSFKLRLAFIYADKDGTIKGSYTKEERLAKRHGKIIINVTLKAGWNIVLEKEERMYTDDNTTYRTNTCYIGKIPRDMSWIFTNRRF